MSLFGLGKALVGAVVKPVARVAKASVQVVTMNGQAPDSLENIITGTERDLRKIGSEAEDIFEDDES
jgi:hypothetical protein